MCVLRRRALAFFFSGDVYAYADYYFSPCKTLCFGSLNEREIFLAVLFCMNILGQVWLQDIFFFLKLPTPPPQKSKGPLLNRVRLLYDNVALQVEKLCSWDHSSCCTKFSQVHHKAVCCHSCMNTEDSKNNGFLSLESNDYVKMSVCNIPSVWPIQQFYFIFLILLLLFQQYEYSKFLYFNLRFV